MQTKSTETPDCIGIDYSSKKVAWAVLSGGRPSSVLSYSLGSRSTDQDDNFDLVMMEFTGWVESYAERLGHAYVPPSVALESPITGMSGNQQTMMRMAMVAGSLATIIKSLVVIQRFYLVAPMTWKKQVCGYGRLDKEGVGRWLQEYHPDLLQECSNDDEVDAMCMALYASKQWEDEVAQETQASQRPGH